MNAFGSPKSSRESDPRWRARAGMLERGPRMEPRNPTPITPREVIALITAPERQVYYVSSGRHPGPGADPGEVFMRVALITAHRSFAALETAHREWCTAATKALGAPVPMLVAKDLINPEPATPWANLDVPVRATLLRAGIEVVAGFAEELAIFDLGEYGRVAIERAELDAAAGVPSFEGIALEHIFYGLVGLRTTRESGERVVVGPDRNQAWWLRPIFSPQHQVWQRCVVMVPPFAFAGVALANLGEWVMSRMLVQDLVEDLRVDPRSPAQLAPEIREVMRAGLALLAPRVTSLVPAPPGSLRH